MKKQTLFKYTLVFSSLLLAACQDGTGPTTGTISITVPSSFPYNVAETIPVNLAVSPSTTPLGFSNLTLHTTIQDGLNYLTISPSSTCLSITAGSTATSCNFIVTNNTSGSTAQNTLDNSGYYVTGQLNGQTVTSNVDHPGTEPPTNTAYWAITIDNKSSSNQYLFIFGQNPTSNAYGVVTFANSSVSPVNVYGTFNTYSPTTQYGSNEDSIILEPGLNTIHIPYGIAGGRAYISNQAMQDLELNSGGGITTPVPGDSSDVNYNTIYDDFEFTYDTDQGNTAAVINQTAVDFLSTPICLQAPPSYSPVQTAGFCNIDRDTLLTAVSTDLGNAVSGGAAVWGDLILKNGGTTLRIMNPGNSSETAAFLNYFSTYVTALATTYSAANSLVVVSPDGTETDTGRIVGTTYTFTDQHGNSGTMPLTSQNLLTGAAPTTDAATVTAYQMISSAFMAGQLPPTTAQPSGITESYLQSSSATFYTQPTTTPPLGTPYQYSVYSNALDAVGKAHNDNNIYTWAYDDVLGKSSTMTQSLNLGPSEEPDPITVTVRP